MGWWDGFLDISLLPEKNGLVESKNETPKIHQRVLCVLLIACENPVIDRWGLSKIVGRPQLKVGSFQTFQLPEMEEIRTTYLSCMETAYVREHPPTKIAL